MPRPLTLALALGLVAACKERAPVEPPPPVEAAPEPPIERTITATIPMRRLLEHEGVFTSGELQSAKAAADYLERKLRALDLAPPFGASFRQPVERSVAQRTGERTALAQGDVVYVLDRDFAPFGFSSNASVEAPLVFAGYGISAKEHAYDDYAGLDVAGKIAVILPGEPEQPEETFDQESIGPHRRFEGDRATRHASLEAKIARARRANVRALLMVEDPRTAPLAAETDAGIVAARVSAAAAKRLLGFDPREERAEIDRTLEPRSRASERPAARLDVSLVRTPQVVENVAAVLAPKTAAGSVVVLARYDHRGDNAAGTAAVLEIARAFAVEPSGLRRRVIFAFLAGEEGGSTFANHAREHLGPISAVVRLDGMSPLRDRTLHVSGPPGAAQALVERALEARGLEVAYLAAGDAHPFAAGTAQLVLSAHAPGDPPARRDEDVADLPGMSRAAGAAADLTRALAGAGW